MIAEDRTMFYLKAGFHMIADLIAICDPLSLWKPALNDPLVTLIVRHVPSLVPRSHTIKTKRIIVLIVSLISHQ